MCMNILPSRARARTHMPARAWCPRRCEKMVAESCKTRVTDRCERWVLAIESGPLARAPSALNC